MEQGNQSSRGPVTAAWVCIVIGWLFFLLPIPLVSIAVGGLFLSIALILSIVVLAKGTIGQGVLQILVNLIGSPIIYFIGLALFGSMLGGADQKVSLLAGWLFA